MKLRTKIMLLVCCTVVAILLLNQYPVSMSLQQSATDVMGSAMQDCIRQASQSPDVLDGVRRGDRAALAAAAGRVEACDSCSGLAIVGPDFQLYYNSAACPVEPDILADYQADPGQSVGYQVVRQSGQEHVLYAYCPIYDDDGFQGAIISKLLSSQLHSGIQKAQRDLNAITVLVLLISLIFVWQLTDNITSTMFHLEPVEIAQLLVERNSLIDAVRDGIISVDGQGRLHHANRSALELFQRFVPEFDARAGSFQQLFPHIPFGEMFQSDRPRYDVECLMGSDSFYVSFIPIRIQKPQHESMLVTFRPKQEVVQFAEHITSVRSYIEALRSQMHEFNNKLQVMSGLVQAHKFPQLEEYLYSLVRLHNREMEQISRKISDPILAAFLMSKFDRASEQQVDLVLTDATSLHTQLSEVLVQDLVVIIGNLLENAFDAVQGCHMRTVTLELTETSGDICVSIWDSGQAVPPEIREHIFDYGVTGKRTGSGIGLFLVHQACQRHSGYIMLNSNEGEGTEFTVHLPLSEGGFPGDASCSDC